MIIVGYQGIGKSTLAKNHFQCIDLESSNFFVDGKRDDNWYKVYVNIAKHLSDQGNIVFMSSHKVIREYMNEQNIEFTVICPSLELKEEWLKKLRDRYVETKKDKDFRAWQNAVSGYDEQIKDLMNENNVISLEIMDYQLADKVRDGYLNGDEKCNSLESELDWQTEESVSIDNVEFNSEVYDNEV